MSTTAGPAPGQSPGAIDPAHLTFAYSENEDGWVTAQIVEFPEAISQGPSREEAMMNALEALHDLTHAPTLAERLAFALESFIEPLDELRREVQKLWTATAGRRRDPVA